MIFLEGVPAVLLGVIVYFSLPDSPRRAAWMSESELSELENAIAVEKGGTKTESSSGTTVWSTMANAKLWALGVVYFGLNAGIVVLLFFLPQVIKTFEGIFGRKYSVTDIGMISAVPFSFAVLFLIFWGRYMTKRRLTAIHVAGPLGLAAASIGVALLLHSPFQVMTAFAIGTAGCFVTLTTFWQLPSRFLDGRSAAAGIGLISGLGLVSAVVLPYFIGWMKDKTGSFTSAFLCVAGFMALGALVVVIMDARLKKGSSV
jgi:cyanate permease